MKPIIMVLDNYDSFTYNLVQLLGTICSDKYDIEVIRNDQIDLKGVQDKMPALIVVSPGPGRPEEAGISVRLMGDPAIAIPRLGVCLGHQALAHAFGAKVVAAPRLVHGKTSSIYHDGRGVYQGLTNPFQATRYHSLIVEEESLPPELVVSSWTSNGEVMGIRHRSLPLEGVQFHPESLETREGLKLLRNFVDLAAN